MYFGTLPNGDTVASPNELRYVLRAKEFERPRAPDVSISHSKRYVAFFVAILVSAISAISAICCGKDVADVNARYHFSLIKGKELPVCLAYLERLNAVDYYHEAAESALSAPYCGRPENNSVSGFALLKRVPLTVTEARALLPSVFSFTHPGLVGPNSGSAVYDFGRIVEPGQEGLSIWRFDSKVDIENNGVPDDVIVWQGFGASLGSGVCGVDYGHTGPWIYRPLQLAYILTADGKMVDESKTQAIFGRQRRDNHDSPRHVEPGFRPIGTSISIFKFQDLYYFDAEYGGWAMRDKREGSYIKTINTFGLFLRQNGTTRNLCEVLMRDGDHRSVVVD
jgi:hypothetical protein